MPSMVVIPSAARPTRLVPADKVHSVLCHRIDGKEEQYLVRWNSSLQTPPLSWHNLSELGGCLEYVQDYLDKGKARIAASAQPSKKRKSPDTDSDIERPARLSPFRTHLYPPSRTPSTDRSISSPTLSSISHNQHPNGTASAADTVNVYNGVLDVKDGTIIVHSSYAPHVAKIGIRSVPTPEMAIAARDAPTYMAEIMVRAAYMRKLENVPGKKIHLTNTIDATSPSLKFRFIADYVLGEGVYRAAKDTQVGCQQCASNMGQSIGCEYTRKCDCLEFAAVDESRLDENQKRLFAQLKKTGGSTLGLPKKFPYYAEGVKVQKAGCLVSFYLNSRRPIYECNDNCRCGPYCRNKLVQFGRTVELEIFKTKHRGWGLRCKQDLKAGQFIDTYRGEILTDAEATRREETSSKAKASYLYELDKFKVSEGLRDEDIYVVDGEFMGGPTKFINHSCEPNCRQYTVSYNKYDCRVYDIAFFARRNIPKGGELTFDYLDKDEEDGEEDPGEGSVPCLCGAAKCRKWMWM
ncbi:SET domain-containing protein [Delitschia confertaspora ATCC 74209]|uniref:SET domain-containing protein n=1 Tax=Delitschia confertaspora ATCC 74209 TaxID=1513339 RepID=A0A9P4JD59_9PLEO|nr:SET domain-containing protein [Delitschia confertaspora ATCC 74209]